MHVHLHFFYVQRTPQVKYLSWGGHILCIGTATKTIKNFYVVYVVFDTYCG